jgi:hypothetical protein
MVRFQPLTILKVTYDDESSDSAVAVFVFENVGLT